MTKYISCDENGVKEFDNFEDAVAFAKTMEDTAVVYMKTGTICEQVWRKSGVCEDA